MLWETELIRIHLRQRVLSEHELYAITSIIHVLQFTKVAAQGLPLRAVFGLQVSWTHICMAKQTRHIFPPT